MTDVFLNLITRKGMFGTGEDGWLVNVLQRNRTNRICFYISISIYERGREREIDFEELAPTVLEAWKDQNLQRRLAGWNFREELQSKFKGSLLAEFLLALGRSVFVLLRPSNDWMRPTDTDNLLYSDSMNLNVNLTKQTKKHPHRNIQNNVWPNIWAPWPNQIDT